MKTNLLLFVFLLTGTLFLNSCDEETGDLLEDLAQGKMVVIINNGTPETIVSCTWENYGEDMKGEVFVHAYNEGTTGPNIAIIYGSYTNEDPLSVKSYSTAVEADKINFMGGSYGNSADNATVVVEVVEITATGIKGKFSGKLLTENETLVDVKGAFWAVKSEHTMY